MTASQSRSQSSRTRQCLDSTREVSKLPILFLLALFISLSACVRAKNMQGKWDADLASQRSGENFKVIFDFLPDGTFNAMPPGDTAIVDQGKYQLLDEGRTLKFRSQLVGGDAVCKVTDDAMECVTDSGKINFKKLSQR